MCGECVNDSVNHPSHYNLPGKKECIEQMLEDYGSQVVYVFCMTNAYKYLYRAGLKEDNPEVQDISKAKWYARYAKSVEENVIFSQQLLKLASYVEERLWWENGD